MRNLTDLIIVAGFCEAHHEFSMANKILVKVKKMVDNFPSREFALEEIKKISEVEPGKCPTTMEFIVILCSIRWGINLSNTNIHPDNYLPKMTARGLHQFRRDILTELVRITKVSTDLDSIESIFVNICNELDLANAKKIQSIARLRKIDSPSLDRTIGIMISLLEQKFDKILELVKEDKKESEKLFKRLPIAFLYVYEKTDQFQHGVELVSTYLNSVKEKNEKYFLIKNVMSYIFSLEVKADLAIKFLDDVVVGDESLKDDDEYKIIRIIIYLYYKKYRELDKALSSPDAPKDILKEKCLDEFIESARNDFLPKEAPKVSKNKKRIVEMHGTCFGHNQYIEDLFTIGLPSLLSTPDFTMVKDKYDLRIHIDTTEECKSEIDEKIQFLRDFGLAVTVDSSVLLSNSVARNRLGIAFYRCIQRCYVDNAIYINFPPDVIYGHGIFTMCENCPEGGAAGGGLIRSSESKARRFMKTGLFASLLKSKNRNSQLAQLAFSEWRNDFQRYYNSAFAPYTNFFIEDQELYLNQPFGAIFFAKPDKDFMKMLNKSWCPRYSGNMDVYFWDMYMQTFDHNLPVILAEKGLYYGAKSTDEWIVCEPSADQRYIPQLKGIHPLKAVSVLSLEKQKEITKCPYKINIENSIFPQTQLLI